MVELWSPKPLMSVQFTHSLPKLEMCLMMRTEDNRPTSDIRFSHKRKSSTYFLKRHTAKILKVFSIWEKTEHVS